MAGLATVALGGGSLLQSTFHSSFANKSVGIHPSHSTATSYSSRSLRCAIPHVAQIQSELVSPKGLIGFRIPARSHARYPDFIYEKTAHQSEDGRRRRRRRTPAIIRATAASGEEAEMVNFARWSVSKVDLEVVIVAVSTALLATANKVLYKMALVPMKEYPFFLAQFNTFGYVLVYFTVLYSRYKAGIVTDDMLSLPKKKFAGVGACEALGLASGMAAAAVLPAASVPVLLQVFLVWQLLLSYVFLGKRYTTGQIAGCLLVATGVIIVVASGGGTDSLKGTGILWPAVMIMSALFSASGSILKESIFNYAKEHLKSGQIDIFVVNSFGSGFQALFVLLLLPLLSTIRGIPFHQLGSYLKEGSACFFNVGSPLGCVGSPIVPLSYVLVNLSFNISALYLMKISSAILSSLCATASVPLAIYVFTLPLPYLGSPPPLPPKLLLGSAILVMGLALYNLSNPKVQTKLQAKLQESKSADSLKQILS